MGAPDWADEFPIQNGDIPASYVSWNQRVLTKKHVYFNVFFPETSNVVFKPKAWGEK